MNWLQWLTMVAVVVRGTRLLVKDEFPPVRWLRETIVDQFGQFDAKGKLVAGRRLGGLGYSIAYVFTCYWCMSFWVALGIALGFRLAEPVGFVAVAMLAAGAWGTLDDLADQHYEIKQLEIERRKEEMPR